MTTSIPAHPTREKTVTTRADEESSTRLFYLDNLRIYLTILVILHHTAIAYGGAGDWAIIDPAVDDALHDFVGRRKAEMPDAWY